MGANLGVGVGGGGRESSKAAAEERWRNGALSELWKSSNVYGRNAAAAAEECSIPRPFTAGTGNNPYKG